MTKTTIVLLVLFILISSTFAEEGVNNQSDLKLKVTVRVANIRKGPSLESKIIAQVTEGTILDIISKAGNWYLIVVPARADKPATSGYIYKGIVKEVRGTEAIKAPPKIEPKIKEKKKIIPMEPLQRAVQYPETVPTKKMFIRASFSMGFLQESTTSSWTETIYNETATSSLDNDIQKGNPISIAFGYRFSNSLGVELGADISSRNLDGSYSSSIPHPLIFQANRTAEGTGSYKLSENSIFLNIVYSSRFSKFGLDLFAGPAYILSKATIISEIAYSHTYPYDSVTLTASTTDVSQNVFGFNVGANILFYINENIAVGLNARYLNGTATFETGTGIPGLEITLGGFKAGAGLKFLF